VLRSRFVKLTTLAAACVIAVPLTGPAVANRPAMLRAAAAVPCTILPRDNVWHSAVTTLPRNSRSATYVRSIGATGHLHPDFGSGLIDGAPFGMPITMISRSAAAVRITFQYASESDRGPYRIPATAAVEGGSRSTGDRHVIVLDTAACTAYELYDARRQRDGSWTAGSGAIFHLRSDALRPAGWTSADAAGLPIIAGLVRYTEVANGHIDHAIRMTVPRTDRSYLWPARHFAAPGHNAALPPMGLRMRLKSSVSIAGLPPQARVIAQALKTYGAIVGDNGSAWYISGTQDARWSNSQLNTLKRFTGSNFEAVDENGLRISANSGRARR
jgi:hypothetical protein